MLGVVLSLNKGALLCDVWCYLSSYDQRLEAIHSAQLVLHNNELMINQRAYYNVLVNIHVM